MTAPSFFSPSVRSVLPSHDMQHRLCFYTPCFSSKPVAKVSKPKDCNISYLLYLNVLVRITSVLYILLFCKRVSPYNHVSVILFPKPFLIFFSWYHEDICSFKSNQSNNLINLFLLLPLILFIIFNFIIFFIFLDTEASL